MVFILIAVSLLSIFLEFYLPGGVLNIVGALIAIVAFFEAYYLYGTLGCLFVVFLYAAFLLGVIHLALRLIRKTGPLNTMTIEELHALTGAEGQALSELSPSGFASIGGQRYHVLSQGPYIEKGESIIVVDSRGGYLVVKQKNPKEPPHVR